MEPELVAFSDLFDATFSIREELKFLYFDQKVTLHLFMDSKTLFDVKFKGKRSSETRLLLNLL